VNRKLFGKRLPVLKTGVVQCRRCIFACSTEMNFDLSANNHVTKHSIEAYGHDEFLFQVVGARHAKSFYDVFANGDVVSGIIALIVTILIVPSFLASYFFQTVIVVPDWITSGWLLILGFYFGKASGRSG
jgi:hypothetical protein